MRKRIKKISKKTKDNFKKYMLEIWHIICKPEIGILPGQLAFFMLLSIVPIITLIISLSSLFGVNASTIYDFINSIVPAGSEYLHSYVTGGSLSFTMVLVYIWMFYMASAGFNQVILISNQIYGIQDSSFIRRRIKAIIMLLLVVILLLFILLVPIFGLKILSLLKIQITPEVTSLYSWIKGPITWILIFLFIRLLYQIAPDKIRRTSHINTGAIFASIGWIICTVIYSNLANNMSTYNFLYGTLASIAFLMIWLYFMSFIFVIGMSLNYGQELDQEAMDKTGAVKIVKNR